MQNRINCLKSYQENLKKDLLIFIKMIQYCNGNIYLVSSSAECTSEIILNIVSIYEPECIIATKTKIDEFGDLSSFLYLCISNNCKHSLILDFTNIYVNNTSLRDNELSLLEEINSNRDIFVEHFNKTIIILSNSMSFWFQTMARDICSCISLHIDMSNWFIIPEDRPVFHLNLPYVIHFDSSIDKIDHFKKYLVLKEKIESLTKYEKGIEKKFIEEINMVDYIFRDALVYTFAKKICTIPTCYDYQSWRMKLVEHLCRYAFKNDALKAQLYCDCGELFYINGKFEKANINYKEASTIMIKLKKCEKNLEKQWQYYSDIVACNIMLCQSQINNSKNFISLKSLTTLIEKIYTESEDDIIKMYLQSYLFIYKVCLGNCNYVTLLDLYEHESEFENIDGYKSVNIYKNILFWVHYIVCEKFKISSNLDIENPWTLQHITIATMIQNFKLGSYTDATYFYIKAKKDVKNLVIFKWWKY